MKKKQKLRFAAIVSLLVISISIISIRAVGITSEKERAFKEEIETNVPATPTSAEGIWLTGDSVILGIRNALAEQYEVGLINARVGRQAPELLAEIQHDLENAPSGPVVMNLGNNNALSEEQVISIFETLQNQERVIVVNTAVPRPWRVSNNELIAGVSTRFSNIRIVDWALISDGHPEYFAPDGVHLVPTGVEVYVAEISKYL